MKRPSLQFYPGDWRRDSRLQSCSIGARGVWIEVICIMHDSEPYGHLQVGGKIIDTNNLARMIGCKTKVVAAALHELEVAGVFSRTEEGVIYSRRMVKDEDVRNKRAAGGKLGGNPNLCHEDKVNHKDNLTNNNHANLQVKQTVADSNSSNSSLQGDARGKRFLPPTVEETLVYAREIGLPENECHKAHDFYTAKGWLVGRSMMKDWRACWRKWRREWQNGTYAGNGKAPPKPVNLDSAIHAAKLARENTERTNEIAARLADERMQKGVTS